MPRAPLAASLGFIGLCSGYSHLARVPVNVRPLKPIRLILSHPEIARHVKPCPVPLVLDRAAAISNHLGLIGPFHYLVLPMSLATFFVTGFLGTRVNILAVPWPN